MPVKLSGQNSIFYLYAESSGIAHAINNNQNSEPYLKVEVIYGE